MSDQDKEYLRDLMAMFAMNGLIHHYDFDRFKQDPSRVAEYAYDMADQMMKARNRNEEDIDNGIAAVIPKRKRSRSNS